MGIYNRDYYRESRSNTGDWGLELLTPVVKWLIIINVAVFLLQIFIVREERISFRDQIRKYQPELDKLLTEKEEQGPEAVEAFKKKHPHMFDQMDEELSRLLPPERVSILQEWFELKTDKVVYSGQVWRLLTHAFCHDRYGLFHILFNMLFLYWFGGTLEVMYGSREFLLFYLTAAVVAGLAFVGLDLYTGSTTPGIGASGAVMAVTMLYTMHYPRMVIYVCWFLPVEMRILMALYVIWDVHPVLLALAGDRMFTGIAHAAHLGGLAFGFLYAKYGWQLEPLLDKMSWARLSRWPRRRPRLRLMREPLPEPEHDPLPDKEPDAGMVRVDQLLQKISESGQASLTDDERLILKLASEKLRKNRTD